MRRTALAVVAIGALWVAGAACGGKKKAAGGQAFGFLALSRLHGPSSLIGEILLADGRFTSAGFPTPTPTPPAATDDCVSFVPSGGSTTLDTADILVAGTAFTVTGPAGALDATWLPGYFEYYGEGPTSLWVPAASYTFDVRGGGKIGAFQTSIVAPSDFLLTSPALSSTSQKVVFSVSQPLNIAWVSSAGTDVIRGGMEEYSDSGTFLRSAQCSFVDDGAATIPVSALAGFHDDLAGGYVHRLVLAKYHQAIADAPGLGPVEVDATAEWILPAYASP